MDRFGVVPALVVDGSFMTAQLVRPPSPCNHKTIEPMQTSSIASCGIIHSDCDPTIVDSHGCIFPIGHVGPHEFVTLDARHFQWETDLACECEHCMKAQGDYCTTYWEVSNTPVGPTPTRKNMINIEDDGNLER